MGILRAAAAFWLLASSSSAAAAPAGSTLIVAVDPRLELLGVVSQLARARLEPGFKINAEVARRFGAFSGHPAVTTYLEGYRKLKDRESFGLIALYLTPPPALAWAHDPQTLSVDFIQRGGGRPAVERFLAELRDFSKRSDFLAFYAGRRSLHARAEESARAGLSDFDYLGEIERYMGRGIRSRMNVFVTILYGEGLSYMTPYPYQGQGRMDEGPYDVYASIRPREAGDPPVFHLDDPLDAGVFNEFLFAYVDRYLVDFEPDVKKHEPLHATLQGQCFPTWLHCADHLIVLALSDRLSLARAAALPKPPMAAPRFAALRKLLALLDWSRKSPDDRVRVVRARLGARLAEYENDRGRYRKLEDFYPRLLDAFSEPAPAR